MAVETRRARQRQHRGNHISLVFLFFWFCRGHNQQSKRCQTQQCASWLWKGHGFKIHRWSQQRHLCCEKWLLLSRCRILTCWSQDWTVKYKDLMDWALVNIRLGRGVPNGQLWKWICLFLKAPSPGAFFFPLWAVFSLRSIKICKQLILYYSKLRVTFVHDLAARNLIPLFVACLTNKRHTPICVTKVFKSSWQCVDCVSVDCVSHPETPAVNFLPWNRASLKISPIKQTKGLPHIISQF